GDGTDGRGVARARGAAAGGGGVHGEEPGRGGVDAGDVSRVRGVRSRNRGNRAVRVLKEVRTTLKGPPPSSPVPPAPAPRAKMASAGNLPPVPAVRVSGSRRPYTLM